MTAEANRLRLGHTYVLGWRPYSATIAEFTIREFEAEKWADQLHPASLADEIQEMHT